MPALAVFSPKISNALVVQRRVIMALILRDMKTRFGRSYLGYLIAIAWPLSHMLGILGAQYAVGRVVPIGTDLTIFAATGILPYILAIYPARMMMYAVEANKPLLLFSVVKTVDMIIARGILEILTACAVTMVFGLMLYVADVDFTPLDTGEAVMAVLASIYLGVSIGFVNALFFMIFRMGWAIVFIVIFILMYATSGALILSSSLSQEVRDVLWFNPIFQCVEWLRSAYYDAYSGSSLSRTYVLFVATVCLFIGLAGERVFRGRFYH